MEKSDLIHTLHKTNRLLAKSLNLKYAFLRGHATRISY